MFNGICDSLNDNENCRFDGYDCCNQEGSTSITCDIKNQCDMQLMSNQVCDTSVNTSRCHYDMGRCCTSETTFPECSILEQQAGKSKIFS